MESEKLTIVDERSLMMAREPIAILEEAKKAATALQQVIANKRKPVIINGEQYLEFEDWMTVGRFFGITVKVTQTNQVSFGDYHGFEARAVAIHAGTGEEISAAEAMCLDDEDNWKGKPLFMLRSMAQTRACAKALRNVLAWVVVLAGFKPTPAEEMDAVMSRPQTQMPREKLGAIEVIVERVSHSVGKKTDGTEYVRYTLHSGDKKFNTFSKSIAEIARKSIEQGASLIINYKESKYGYDIVDATLVEPSGAKE